jgi:glycosyltransferase involved in cell wall biosynthesis
MRILVVPKNLEVGGSQLTAVRIAAALTQRGHDVLVASPPGPANHHLAVEGIRIAEIPPPRNRVRRLEALIGIKRDHGSETIHAYEMRSIMEACLASLRDPPVPILGTIMSTRVPWYLPESVSLTVGMPNLAEFTSRWRKGSTTLIEPPVEGLQVSDESRSHRPSGSGRPRIVLVSRLVEPFKREGILRVIAAMRTLGQQGFVLEIIGDGPARTLFEGAARPVNEGAPTPIVRFLGEHLEARFAISSADVVVGNGLSVMQGVMMGRPSVVVGREGFSTVVDSNSLPGLMDRGFYGVGDGIDTEDPLPEQIHLAMSPTRESELAELAGQIEGRYGLTAVTQRFEAELDRVRRESPPGSTEMVRALARAAHYRARRRFLREKADRLGLTAEANDDFVFGRLRDLALPPASFGTGRNVGG